MTRDNLLIVLESFNERKVPGGVKAPEVETNGRHNKAVSDNFHIGLKKLSRKFISPPKAQLRFLSINARYQDPRLSSDDSSHVSWPSTVRGSPSRHEVGGQMKETSPELGPVLSQEAYLGTPVEEEEDQVDEDEEPGSPPIRCPFPKPAGLFNVKPSTPSVYKSRTGGQVPSSSLSIDYELEQEWPTALISSSAPFPTHSRSPTPVPNITSLTTAHPPMLQIERSPIGPEISRRSEQSLFRATITRDGLETSKAVTRAISSDPIIPATCVDSPETITSQNVSQEESLHSVVPTSGLAEASGDRLLVLATIPAKPVAVSSDAHLVNSSASEAGTTIFDRFKLEYPGFQHQRSKFVMACTYIKWLQNNRKVMPVHQFLWDDFIRVFCGPYSHHVRNQRDEGGHTESPVDFYNNEVTSPVFHSNIVTQKTLPLALSSDPDLTRKHTQKLRRISSNSVAYSESTTPREQMAAGMAKTTRSAPEEARTPHAETPTKEERGPRLAPPGSPILGKLVPEEAGQQEPASTTTIPGLKIDGASRTAQTAERREAEDVRRPLSAFVTPRNATIPPWATLTRGNNTSIELSPPLLDAVERDVKSRYVPMIHKSKKGRSRYSLPGPEST